MISRIVQLRHSTQRTLSSSLSVCVTDLLPLSLLDEREIYGTKTAFSGSLKDESQHEFLVSSLLLPPSPPPRS